MRAFLAGTLLLLFASAAFGQLDVTGGVESIGFDQNYRPDCWTPMLVNLTSKNPDPSDYEIQVEQEDIDGDTVVYSRTITLNANAQQKYWVYFLPTTRGYPSINTQNVNELKRALRVNLYTTGGKFVCPIPLTPGAGMVNLNPMRGSSGFSDNGPDKKLVLVVGAETGSASWREYMDAIGLIEDVQFVPVRTGDLPENPLAFEAVDAVLWLNANAADLTTGGSHKLQALEQWISKGGNFVVCHTLEQNRVEPFADLLPIHLKTEAGDKAVEWIDCAEPEPLYRIVRQAGGNRFPAELDYWKNLPKGKYKVARASAKPGAMVEEWVDWDAANPPEKPAGTVLTSKSKPTTKPANLSPYIVRMSHGAGAVTWVAQDLSSTGITSNRLQGWPYIWDTVFGWKNETLLKSYREKRASVGDMKEEMILARSTGVNIGNSAKGDSKFDSKAGAYVALAILFFIGYWVVAGPGGYVFLASKGRRQFSWQIFAVCAILATALTVGVVKLVLRGEPEVKHFTVVRMTEGKPSVISSRFGLYIPRDGLQEIKLTGAAPNEVSTLHAVAEQPEAVANREGFTDTSKYTIPVHDNTDNGEVSIRIPFRSTEKKMQAQWVGDTPFAIAVAGNRPAVVPPIDLSTPGKPLKRGTIRGKLTNNSGVPLRNVFFAFRHERSQDYIFFVPSWDKGETLDLELAYNEAKRLTFGEAPTFNRSYSGLIVPQWGGFWHDQLRPSSVGANSVDDSNKGVRIYLAMMSIFDRVPPAHNKIDQSGDRTERGDVLRRGGRSLDLSATLTAGDLLILAESGSQSNPVPLPFPMEVEGEKITGSGTVYYQFVMTLDRTGIENESALGDASAVSP